MKIITIIFIALLSVIGSGCRSRKAVMTDTTADSIRQHSEAVRLTRIEGEIERCQFSGHLGADSIRISLQSDSSLTRRIVKVYNPRTFVNSRSGLARERRTDSSVSNSAKAAVSTASRSTRETRTETAKPRFALIICCGLAIAFILGWSRKRNQ